MQVFNFHTHTPRCHHAENVSDEAFVEAHIKAGFKRMAFTDHCPLETFPKGLKELMLKRHSMPMEQRFEYLESVDNLKKKYQDEITIYKGYELEWAPTRIGEIHDRRKESEVLVLGQHFAIDPEGNEYHMHMLGKNPGAEYFYHYANAVKAGVELGAFDILAHPDLFGLFDVPFDEDQEKASHIILEAAEKSGIPLEINLGNVYRKLAFGTNPHFPLPDFWRMATSYNVQVIYGIDAHTLQAIGMMEQSVEMANTIIGSETLSKLHFLEEIDFEKKTK